MPSNNRFERARGRVFVGDEEGVDDWDKVPLFDASEAPCRSTSSLEFEITTVPNSRKRPPGLSIIAVLLVVLAVSGFLNAFIWPQLDGSLPQDAPAHLRDGVHALASPAASAVAILYAITALCAAVGVWKTKAWAPLAILVWGGCVLILGGIFAVRAPQMAGAPLESVTLACVGLGAVAIAILGVMWWYVRGKVSGIDL